MSLPSNNQNPHTYDISEIKKSKPTAESIISILSTNNLISYVKRVENWEKNFFYRNRS